LPRALRARDRLIEKYGAEVELVKGVAGVFEITVDGTLAFSKKQLGRFPEDAEIDAVGGG
jgi:selT/selW/selH-like putative selenoprotein